MTYEIAEKSAHFLIENSLKNNAIPNITFFGGEPLLMWDSIIAPLVLYVREKRRVPFHFSITTNGLLLTKDKLDFMKKNDVGILFSIDGDKETQDYNRPLSNGQGSFDLLKHNIPRILQYFPNTTFRSTIIPATCEHTWDNINFAIQNGYKAIFTTPNIFEEWSEKDRETLKEQLQKYSDYYIDCFQNGSRPVIFTSLEETMKRVLDINSAERSEEYRERAFCLSCGKCGLGSNNHCAISPTGDIYACQELTSNEGPDSPFYIGTILGGVDEDRRSKLMNSYFPFKATGGKCSECKYNRICDGGCVANNYMINGDIHANPEMYCWWRQLLLSEAEKIIAILGNQKNQKFKEYWVMLNAERKC